MDYVTVSHDELMVSHREQAVLIARLEATVAQLAERVRELEGRGGSPRGMPGHNPDAPGRLAPAASPTRRTRALSFTRRRSDPTTRVVFALATCPSCGSPLAGGSVKRTRAVIELPLVSATVTAYDALERCCPDCRERHTPAVDLSGIVVGQSRLGVGLVSLIATLREELRLPVRSIQTYLASVHGRHLSVGALVAASTMVADAGQAAYAQLARDVRASRVVHADETGWREDGTNGYIWTFSTPDTCYFRYGRRTKVMVDQVLGETAAGVLVSDFYAAYDHYPGLQQKCWAHLLRDIHDLRVRDPADAGVTDWAAAVTALYARAVASTAQLAGTPAETPERQQARRHLMADLVTVCAPFLADDEGPPAAQTGLCKRIDKQLAALFIFVLDPAVPATNNAAERSLRHLVVSRTISGGTRSARGTTTKLVLASLFGTWRLRGLNPFDACRALLTSPQA